MDKTYNAKDIWNKASEAAFVVGIIPIAVSLLSILVGKWSGDSTIINITKGFVSFILWAAKFAGCIYLMKFFMERFQQSFPGICKADLFKFGSLVAVLSALIVSAYELIDFIYLEPEKVDAIKELFNSPVYSKLDANSVDVLNKISDSYPQVAFASKFVYCTVYGIVLSSIIAARLAPSNPFEK